MASSTQPRNRKERHAQTHSKTSSDTRTASVTLSQPSRGPPSNKTLLEIAAERELLSNNKHDNNNTKANKSRPENFSSIVTTVINSDGSLTVSPENTPNDNNHTADSGPIPTPYLDVALYTINLTLLHFTLTLLVHHQYATERPSVRALILSSTVFSFAPWLILLLVLLLHPRSSDLPVQVLFALMSITAGFWLVYATNDEPYMAVMNKAPALGTLWVWAIIELKWEWGLACLGVVGAWSWWQGYSIY